MFSIPRKAHFGVSKLRTEMVKNMFSPGFFHIEYNSLDDLWLRGNLSVTVHISRSFTLITCEVTGNVR